MPPFVIIPAFSWYTSIKLKYSKCLRKIDLSRHFLITLIEEVNMLPFPTKANLKMVLVSLIWLHMGQLFC